MASAASDGLLKFAAWPTALLRTAHGTPVGVAMPRVVGHEDIHLLYSPKSRKIHFPEANFRFLIQAATNVSRAFAALHAARCVVGDVNHGSVLVSGQATVKLVDCDSFQFFAGGRQYPCTVGTPTFTPSELQGKPFAQVVRTPNHDCFGLAVMVFHLLFMGRHPFSGRYRHQVEMSIEKAIAEFRFAYSKDRSATNMDPPPGAPGLDCVPPALAAMFERAFSRPVRPDDSRPSALDWVRELDDFGRHVNQCKRNASHWHFHGLGACPWCLIEQETGVVFFYYVVPAQGLAPSGVDVASLWAQITAIAQPGPMPALPVEGSVTATPVPNMPKKPPTNLLAAHLQTAWWLVACGTIVAMAAVGPASIVVGFIVWGLVLVFAREDEAHSEHRKAVAALEAVTKLAEARWRQVRERWKDGPCVSAFGDLRADLERNRSEILRTPSERQARLQQLHRDRELAQRQEYLERFTVEHARIKGFGAGRKAALASYGIETASDLTAQAIMSVPGFGPALAANLLGWRRSVEGGFRFDASRGVDPRDVATMDRQLAERKRYLESELARGLASLQQLRAQALDERAAKLREAVSVLRELAQARANLQSVC
jgi:DNA-binding helix-hairpin-helix protein with protein kinase domain